MNPPSLLGGRQTVHDSQEYARHAESASADGSTGASTGRLIVEGTVTRDKDVIHIELTPKAKVLLVVEGLVRFDSGDLIITNKRRFWIIDSEAKVVKFYSVNLPKSVKRRIKGKKARVVLQVIE